MLYGDDKTENKKGKNCAVVGRWPTTLV